jgi:hypothetical protein
VVQVAARVLTAVAVALVCTRPALEPVDTMSVGLVELNGLISMIPFHDPSLHAVLVGYGTR